MKSNSLTFNAVRAEVALALVACLLQIGCKPSGTGGTFDRESTSDGKVSIQVKGSDTMVNLAQVWAEEYGKVNPDVSIEVSGGGTGVGFAALTRGTIDMANASRNMRSEEIERAKKNTGKEPVEFVVGYDALAIYVHKDNPLNEITEEQLADIYAEGGKSTKWWQLGVKVSGRVGDDIIRVSRQSSSGTYELFRERVLQGIGSRAELLGLAQMLPVFPGLMVCNLAGSVIGRLPDAAPLTFGAVVTVALVGGTLVLAYRCHDRSNERLPLLGAFVVSCFVSLVDANRQWFKAKVGLSVRETDRD